MNHIKFRICLLMMTTVTFAFAQQSPNPSTPYLKNLSIPEFKLSTIADSSDFSSKNLPKDGILFIKYFNPDCEHCQEEAKMYLSKKDSLKNIYIVWVSGNWSKLNTMKEFAEKYELYKLNTIVIGKESENKLVTFFALEGLPYGALYLKNQLIKEYRGSIDFNELIEINRGNFIPKAIVPNVKDKN